MVVGVNLSLPLPLSLSLSLCVCVCVCVRAFVVVGGGDAWFALRTCNVLSGGGVWWCVCVCVCVCGACVSA